MDAAFCADLSDLIGFELSEVSYFPFGLCDALVEIFDEQAAVLEENSKLTDLFFKLLDNLVTNTLGEIIYATKGINVPGVKPEPFGRGSCSDKNSKPLRVRSAF